jgi:hypothetical protein
MSDEQVLNKIEELVGEEHKLLGVDENHRRPEQHERLQNIEVELDRCWDLLRQRRARREFGQDPDAASVRDERTVEEYLQ